MSHHHQSQKHHKFYCNGDYQECFKVNNLISNEALEAKNEDPNLVDAWNIVILGKNDMWISNKATALLTNYDLSGNIISTPVQVPAVGSNPALPTGLIINESTGFVITNGSNVASSYLLVCTENGTICGYNPLVDSVNAIVAVDNSGSDTCYTGLAMINNYLCATDFHNNKIDVFDFNFVLTLSLPFQDLEVLNPIPTTYAPYNIVNIDDLLYVTYAEQTAPNNTQAQAGSGHGYVSVFNKDGLFVKRFASQGKLNAPYGVVKLPNTFGNLTHKIAIGNYGNGKINVYDCEGHVTYTLHDKYKNKICIEGLHGLTKYDDCSHYIYWASGSTEDLHGLVGNIRKSNN
jgi:uncharacterized protein (TIGR03118 family)